MTDLLIYGIPNSSFVRSTHILCKEKGVAFTAEPVNWLAPEYRQLHPFGKMPAMRHGDQTLFETFAILTYIDETFEGPSFQPPTSWERASMWQWMSAISHYLYPTLMSNIVIQRLVVPMMGGQTDETRIRESLPEAEHQLDILDQALVAPTWLAGDHYSLADMMLAPIVYLATQSPDIGHMILPRENLTRWYEQIVTRPSFQETMPQL